MLQKHLIKPPRKSKDIPTVWKGIWKKELISQGIASCRQINCTYKCSSFEEMCKHCTECSFTPKQV